MFFINPIIDILRTSGNEIRVMLWCGVVGHFLVRRPQTVSCDCTFELLFLVKYSFIHCFMFARSILTSTRDEILISFGF
jgi:hypothetical protein